MKRTESLDRINNTHLLTGNDNKKRSNRSRSRPKSDRSNKYAHHHHHSGNSPSTSRLLSLDTTFEHFDIPKHEGEVKSYKSAKLNDFKGIVSGTYTKKCTPPTKSPSMQILKRPPKMPLPSTTPPSPPFDTTTSQEDDHDHYCECDTEASETSELYIPISPRNIANAKSSPRLKIPAVAKMYAKIPAKMPAKIPPITSDDFETWSEIGDNANITDSHTLWGEGKGGETVKDLPFSLEQLDDWETAFTKNFKEQQIIIQNSAELDHTQKLERLNDLHHYWIVDLYEQLDRFYDAYDAFRKATGNDRKDYLAEFSVLTEDLHKAQRQVSHEQGKVASLEQENSRQLQIIQNLQEKMSNLKISEAENNARDAISNKVQRYVVDNRKITEEQEKLLATLEQHKAKIFLKERRLQKLNIEEHAMKLRIRAAASEEALLKSQINEMKATGRMLIGSNGSKLGRLDTGDDPELDDMWRKLGSGAED